MSARALYTPEILAAAMGLVDHPWEPSLPLQGSARSRSCGSAIELALSTDPAGMIDHVAVRPHACAVGQAAAGVFAKGAKGKARSEVSAGRDAILQWLAGDGPEPAWPGIALLAPALAYPARHAAILLPWDAALDALSSPGSP